MMGKERDMNRFFRSCLLALLFMLWMPGMWVEAAELPVEGAAGIERGAETEQDEL